MPRVVPPIDGKSSRDSAAGVVNPSLVESVAGFSAGVAATLAVHPLDILKTRLQLDQNHKSRWGDSWRVLSKVVKDEGSWRALYRGLMPNMIGNSVSWALYFVWYRELKELAQASRGHSTHLTSSDFFLASAASGILTAICTNPIWVIKTRMISTGASTPGAYRGTLDGALQIARAEGLPGFYRGLLPSLFGVSHGAIQFMAYEKLKRWRSQQKYFSGTGAADGQEGWELSNLDWFCTSALSKMFAGSITYPYQVVRSRLQTYDAGVTYHGAGDVVRQVWRREGIRGFYKGLAPNIIRVLPSTCVTFMVYENTKLYVPRLWHGRGTGEAEASEAEEAA